MRHGDREYITYRSRRQRGAENIFHSEEEEEERVNQKQRKRETWGTTMRDLRTVPCIS
jgi:hypothetical protein